MTEKRYEVAKYDEKAVGGYCVLDKLKPSQTARLGYKNVFISTKEGCDIVCDLLNEQDKTIKELQLQLNLTSDQRNEFHRMVRENVNRVGKLEKDNEELKRRNKVLREDLEQALKELGDD